MGNRKRLGILCGLASLISLISSSTFAEVVVPPPDEPSPARTLRVDYYHSGGLDEEIFSLDRVIVEPLAWVGNPDQPIDTLRLGKYFFEVRDATSGELLYSRGFASIYGEWETTGEARERHRTFHESLRFPEPEGPVEITLLRRDAANRGDIDFQPLWTVAIDPADMFVDRSLLRAPVASLQTAALQPLAIQPLTIQHLTIQHRGDPAHKVDLLFLGDGYTAEQCADFELRARHFTDVLFAYEPFASRRDDFNVWGLCPPADDTGVSRPSTGVHRRSPVGATYDAFGSERYVLTFDNRALRDIAAWAPYDVVEIMVNNETYGGGGIYGQFATVAAGNDWSDYLFIHELGHHFAALADEYYTSAVAYELPENPPEPWEPNVTVTTDRQLLKWRHLVDAETPVPTPWPKAQYEEMAREIQQRRQTIRSEERPESEMSALFREQRRRETELLASAENASQVGVFEGGNYAQVGTYRPQVDCVMFSRNEVPFCAVCQQALEAMIDLLTEAGDR